MKRVLRLVTRALRLRCPHCGRGAIMRSWLEARPRCPSCGFPVERGEGAFLGAVTLNFIATGLVFLALLVGLIVVTLPAPPWQVR